MVHKVLVADFVVGLSGDVDQIVGCGTREANIRFPRLAWSVNDATGVLSLRDPKTGGVMRADHPVIQQLQAKLNPGDAMPGFRITDNPITDRDTGEETGLYWVEAVAS